MNKKLTWVAFGAAFAGMGMAMPSCPGQQAMQQQIDALNAKNGELEKRVQTMNTQLTTVNKDMGDVKTLLSQVSNTVLAQKQAIEQLDAAVKAAASKPAPKAAAKPAPKKKGR